MSFYVCKIISKSVQVFACYCKMFRELTFCGYSVYVTSKTLMQTDAVPKHQLFDTI